MPAYIASQSPSTKAAVIHAPGSSVNKPRMPSPRRPCSTSSRGGAYGQIGFEAVPGDQFIGGSAPGHREPTFDDRGQPAGISAQNDTYDFSGGAGALASAAPAGPAATIITRSHISGDISSTFADGTTYPISSVSGTRITLESGLTTAERAGQAVYANRIDPIAHVSAAAKQGATSVRIGAAATPLYALHQRGHRGELLRGSRPFPASRAATPSP